MQDIKPLYIIATMLCVMVAFFLPLDPARPVEVQGFTPKATIQLEPLEPIKQETTSQLELLPVAPPAPTAVSHTDWLRQAGIPESDWYYADCVINGCGSVSAEGSWSGVERWNSTGSGAYGICQSLPASKMASAGADYMTNPVTQLKWCNTYAQGYGGWKQAWEFRQCMGSCYSPRINAVTTKDHTWW